MRDCLGCRAPTAFMFSCESTACHDLPSRGRLPRAKGAVGGVLSSSQVSEVNRYKIFCFAAIGRTRPTFCGFCREVAAPPTPSRLLIVLPSHVLDCVVGGGLVQRLAPALSSVRWVWRKRVSSGQAAGATGSGWHPTVTFLWPGKPVSAHLPPEPPASHGRLSAAVQEPGRHQPVLPPGHEWVLLLKGWRDWLAAIRPGGDGNAGGGDESRRPLEFGKAWSAFLVVGPPCGPLQTH